MFSPRCFRKHDENTEMKTQKFASVPIYFDQDRRAGFEVCQ